MWENIWVLIITVNAGWATISVFISLSGLINLCLISRGSIDWGTLPVCLLIARGLLIPCLIGLFCGPLIRSRSALVWREKVRIAHRASGEEEQREETRKPMDSVGGNLTVYT